MSGNPIRIVLVGIGKIAKDQHIPSIHADPNYSLVAAVTRHQPPPDIPGFRTLSDLIASDVAPDAVSLCTPPVGRHAIARQAIEAGLHVMLEKPPGASVTEIHDLVSAAEANNVSLFASWHTRAAPAIEPARAWLQGRAIRSVAIIWREDVRRWHPGQEWIWEPGGLGVFDPGINGLSAATRILPHPLFLTEADLDYPSNRAAPIAARLAMSDSVGTPIRAEFDWREEGLQRWDIEVETDGGTLYLSKGGASLRIDDRMISDDGEIAAEYPNLYAHFAQLVRARRSDVDLAPFRLVADAFMLGRRGTVAAFNE